MLIRLAKPTDVKIIHQFLSELENTSFDFPLFEKLFLQNIAHPNYHYLVAFSQNEILGYLSSHAQNLLHHCGMVGEIQELFIPTKHRNKGIGKALIAELERIAKENSWVKIEVTCNKKG